MKYIKLEWPEIQDYMHHPNYQEECFYDASRNVWFVPEDWEPYEEEEPEIGTKEYFNLHDCYDAIGGDWEG